MPCLAGGDEAALGNVARQNGVPATCLIISKETLVAPTPRLTAGSAVHKVLMASRRWARFPPESGENQVSGTSRGLIATMRRACSKPAKDAELSGNMSQQPRCWQGEKGRAEFYRAGYWGVAFGVGGERGCLFISRHSAATSERVV